MEDRQIDKAGFVFINDVFRYLVEATARFYGI